MIPALIIWFCKTYIAPRINKKTALSVLLAFSTLSAFSESGTFTIKRNGNTIGHLSVSMKEEGDQTFLKITSKVDTRFVFRLKVETEDVAHFKSGQLIRSDVNRLVNGNEKEAKETRWTNSFYEIRSGHRTNRIIQPIHYNMMLLYVREPVNLSRIYSDNYQCFLPLLKKGPHQYRVDLPDGNHNEYFFEKGICKRIIVNHGLYTLSMERA